MANGKFVAYYRVSTQAQGRSGLGLDAQRTAVENYLNGGKWELVGEFTEIESGKKSDKDRPQLALALALAKKRKATLVIAKLDRLAREVRFFLEVLDDSKVDLRFVDFPEIDPKTSEGRMILINFANYAEYEGRRIGERTKAALAAAKARGVVLGATGPANLKRNIEARQEAADAFAANVAPTINGLRGQGLSQRAIVEQLNATGVPTPRGGRWSLLQLQRTLARLPA